MNTRSQYKILAEKYNNVMSEAAMATATPGTGFSTKYKNASRLVNPITWSVDKTLRQDLEKIEKFIDFADPIIRKRVSEIEQSGADQEPLYDVSEEPINRLLDILMIDYAKKNNIKLEVDPHTGLEVFPNEIAMSDVQVKVCKELWDMFREQERIELGRDVYKGAEQDIGWDISNTISQ